MKVRTVDRRRDCLRCGVPTRHGLCPLCLRRITPGPFECTPNVTAVTLDNATTACLFSAFDRTGHPVALTPWLRLLPACLPRVPCVLCADPKDPLIQDLARAVVARHPHLALSTLPRQALKTLYFTRRLPRDFAHQGLCLVARP